MDVTEWILFAIIGLIAGLIAGLIGIGGGIITVPALLFSFQYHHMPNDLVMKTAIGTSLGIMVFTAASASYFHYKNGNIVWKVFTLFAPGIAVGSIIGSLIADFLPSSQLKVFFAFFQICMGIYFILPIKPHSEETTIKSSYALTIAGVFIGIVSTLLGIGGGILIIPVLLKFKIPLKKAVGTSSFIVLLTAIIGSISFFLLGMSKEDSPTHFGYLYLPAFFVIGIISIFSAQMGANFAKRLQTSILRKVFGYSLIIIALFVLNQI